MEIDKTDYSASESMIGYLFQSRFALLESLKRLYDNPDLKISIETLDDVVFEKKGTAKDLLQLKHHINNKANLTNSSSDLWKSFRIWMDVFNNSPNKSNNTFSIITTSEASEGSAVYYLCPSENRDVGIAEEILIETAKKSKNKKHTDIYKQFLAMSQNLRQKLLESIYIYDKTQNCVDLERELLREVHIASNSSKTKEFLDYLEGWWHKRVIESLMEPNKQFISGKEIYLAIDDLREQFSYKSLPIFEDLKTITVDSEHYDNRTFVEQLKIIDVHQPRISTAINNYYRAFEQRSKWLREDMLFVTDLTKYEQKLIEEWSVHFSELTEELEDDSPDSKKIKCGREVYKWAEQEANIPIRQNCIENFITRGSFHILSDDEKIGWHPDYSKLLKKSKETTEVTNERME